MLDKNGHVLLENKKEEKRVFSEETTAIMTELLTGVKVKDAKSAQLAVDALKRKGVKNVAITMGAKGVYCGNCRRLYPAKKVKAVDCVAAGDTTILHSSFLILQ